jgi:hypothetical protein
MTAVAAILMAGGFCLAQQKDDPKKVEAQQADETIKKFNAAFSAAGPSEDGRAKAIKILTEIRHKKTLATLSTLLLGNETQLLKIAAAEALGTFAGVQGASKPLIQAVGDGQNAKKPEVKKAAIRALALLKAKDALGLLWKLMEEKGNNFEEPREAVIALGEIRHKDSVLRLVNLLKKAEKEPPPNEGRLNGGLVGGIGGVDLPGGGDFDNLPGLGGVAGIDIVNPEQEQIERKRMLEEPCKEALRKITQQPWGPSKEWEIWCRKHLGKFKVQD